MNIEITSVLAAVISVLLIEVAYLAIRDSINPAPARKKEHQQ
jgi:hypothetical protein